MGNSRNKINFISVSWYVLIGFYCLYEFTIYSHLNLRITNLLVLGIISVTSLFVVITLVTKRWKMNMSALAWVPFILVLVYNVVKGYDISKSYVVLFILCVLMSMRYQPNEDMWEAVLKAFKVMAVICAVGVLVQLIVPPVHRILLSLIFGDSMRAYVASYAARGYYSGFVHQVGSCAFYLAAGIIAEIFSDDTKKKKTYMVIFLGIVLLLQGKRSIFGFLIIALLASYILSSKGTKKIRRLAICVLVVMVGWVVLQEAIAMFGDMNLFRKLAYTFEYLKTSDITGLIKESGREHLYELAKSLSKHNPVWGIGWGRFSDMAYSMHGTATSVHNVYLQLQCETGAVGFASFLFGAGFSIITLLSANRRLNAYSGEDALKYRRYFSIAFSGQALFLLFCIVENPLYNENCLIFYFFMIMFTLSLNRKLRELSRAGAVVQP